MPPPPPPGQSRGVSMPATATHPSPDLPIAATGQSRRASVPAKVVAPPMAPEDDNVSTASTDSVTSVGGTRRPRDRSGTVTERAPKRQANTSQSATDTEEAIHNMKEMLRARYEDPDIHDGLLTAIAEWKYKSSLSDGFLKKLDWELRFVHYVLDPPCAACKAAGRTCYYAYQGACFHCRLGSGNCGIPAGLSKEGQVLPNAPDIPKPTKQKKRQDAEVPSAAGRPTKTSLALPPIRVVDRVSSVLPSNGRRIDFASRPVQSISRCLPHGLGVKRNTSPSPTTTVFLGILPTSTTVSATKNAGRRIGPRSTTTTPSSLVVPTLSSPTARHGRLRRFKPASPPWPTSSHSTFRSRTWSPTRCRKPTSVGQPRSMTFRPHTTPTSRRNQDDLAHVRRVLKRGSCNVSGSVGLSRQLGCVAACVYFIFFYLGPSSNATGSLFGSLCSDIASIVYMYFAALVTFLGQSHCFPAAFRRSVKANHWPVAEVGIPLAPIYQNRLTWPHDTLMSQKGPCTGDVLNVCYGQHVTPLGQPLQRVSAACGPHAELQTQRMRSHGRAITDLVACRKMPWVRVFDSPLLFPPFASLALHPFHQKITPLSIAPPLTMSTSQAMNIDSADSNVKMLGPTTFAEVLSDVNDYIATCRREKTDILDMVDVVKDMLVSLTLNRC